MSGLIPLVLALAVLSLAERTPAQHPGMVLLGIAAGGLLAIALLAEAALRWAARSRRYQTLLHTETLLQGAILGWFAHLCLGTGWATWAGLTTLGLLPWILAQCAVWWAAAPAVHAATGKGWSRAGFTLHHLRFDLAPLLIALPLFDACEQTARWWWSTPLGASPGGFAAGWILAGALVVLLVVIAPWLLIRLWGARDLPDSPLTAALRADCAAAGIRVARLMRWPTAEGGRFHNAVAMGLFPRLRYVVFSDDLLADLAPDEVRAVLGHELGHIRHHHLWLYLGFTAAASGVVWSAMTSLVGGLDATGQALAMPWTVGPLPKAGLVFAIPGIQAIPPMLVEAAVLALLVYAVWRWGFGHLSRACERQADLHGASLLGDPAVMARALRAVALRSGQPENAPSWRHHPIAARIAFLERVAVDPAAAADHHRLVGTLRLQVILLVFLALLLGVSALTANPRLPEPQAAIRAMAERDPALGEALGSVQAGNTGPLIRWLNRAADRDKQQLAALTLGECGALPAEHPPGASPDDQDGYRLRHRLTALAAVSTGDPGLDLGLDNVLAYSLVAGTDRPDPTEIAQAAGVLPRLEQAVERLPDHAILDTIACIRFRRGDWSAARRDWQRCLDLLAAVPAGLLPAEERTRLERLYRLRLDAALSNLDIAANRRPGPLRPLPLAFTPAHPSKAAP